MSKMNWTRFLVGTVIVALIAFLSDGYFHEKVVGEDWNAIYTAMGARQPEHQSTSLAYFGVFELGRGIVTMLLYVTMRTCCSPGPKTAIVAGLIAWLAFSVTGPAQFIPLGFFSNVLWIKVGAFQLVTSVVAALAGAAIYKDATTPVG